MELMNKCGGELMKCAIVEEKENVGEKSVANVSIAKLIQR